MSELSGQDELQRNPGAPPLPAHPIRFVLHFVGRRRQWFAAIALLEAASSACGIAIPMPLGRISGAVTRAASGAPVSMDRLRAPILMFLGLGLMWDRLARVGARATIRRGRSAASGSCQ